MNKHSRSCNGCGDGNFYYNRSNRLNIKKEQGMQVLAVDMMFPPLIIDHK
jgi:hypothetical protein